MTRTVMVHPAAVTDLRRAARPHDRRTPQLGQAVVAELQRVMERLRPFPLACPQLRPGIHQVELGPLPYRVAYAVSDDHIIIVAVLHSRRDRRPGGHHHASRHLT